MDETLPHTLQPPEASLYGQAWGRQAARHYEKAAELYRELTRQFPEDDGAYALLTMLRSRLDDADVPALPPREGLQRLAAALDGETRTNLFEENLDFFLEYHARVESWRHSFYMDYPREVHIEALALCNATCGFCPYVSLDRKGTRMPDDLFEKIIDDLTDIPDHIPLRIAPFKVSEPFLDKRLPAQLAYIEKNLPRVKITIATNGSALTEKNIRQLSAVRNPLQLNISLNEHAEAAYEALMGLSFQRTVANMTRLHTHLEQGTFPGRVIVSRVGGSAAEKEAFGAWVRQRFPAFEILFRAHGNWAGAMHTDYEVVPVGCTSWFELSITATGKVALCCMDGHGDYVVGDARHQHVLEIYNNPEHRKYRETAVSRLDVEPCLRCTYPESKPHWG